MTPGTVERHLLMLYMCGYTPQPTPIKCQNNNQKKTRVSEKIVRMASQKLFKIKNTNYQVFPFKVIDLEYMCDLRYNDIHCMTCSISTHKHTHTLAPPNENSAPRG